MTNSLNQMNDMNNNMNNYNDFNNFNNIVADSFILSDLFAENKDLLPRER